MDVPIAQNVFAGVTVIADRVAGTGTGVEELLPQPEENKTVTMTARYKVVKLQKVDFRSRFENIAISVAP